MKLPTVLNNFFQKRAKEPAETLFSLYLDRAGVQASLWRPKGSGLVDVLATSGKPVVSDTWEERVKASDEAIHAIEEETGITSAQKVVLGLPPWYLTPEGDIEKSIRPEIKKLANLLELTPVGFVPIEQAIIHALKQQEGIPANVILIALAPATLAVSLYKIGKQAGTKTLANGSDSVAHVEDALKSFAHVEILPSRILLYGADTAYVEKLKNELLNYPWQTRVNFMHFPKIDIIPSDVLLHALSLAGGSEIGAQLGESEDIPQEEKAAVAQPTFTPHEPTEPNVVLVDPETLGFKKEAAPIQELATEDIYGEEMDTDSMEEPEPKPPGEKPRFVFPSLPALPSFSLPGKKTIVLLPISAIVAVFVVFLLLLWFVPRVTVTVLTEQKSLSDSASLTVDPSVVDIRGDTNTIPGKKQETSVTGEKTIPVVGKKNVGDPAKGAVTIYNKSLSSQTFRKGSTMSAGSLQFTLDSDVQIASASESIGSITFGKGNASVTAKQIGTESNMPARTEFVFKDVGASVAIARNESAFTGGTSREVTVVTRADFDAVVKAITPQLVEKAKQEFAKSVGGADVLLDTTVKTAVTEKSFLEELDQEAKNIHGKVTMTIQGISYSQDDVKKLLGERMNKLVPSGFTLVGDKTTLSMKAGVPKKDGSIPLVTPFTVVVTATIATADIQRALIGASVEKAEQYLRSLVGVTGVIFDFQWSPWKNRLPMHSGNITVNTRVQE